MKKNYDVYGYTAEKLARAKIYETRNRNQGKLCYLVCPHCHKQVDNISFAPVLTSQDFNTKKDLFSNTTQNNVTL